MSSQYTGERCTMCRSPATFKVAEEFSFEEAQRIREDFTQARHPYTAYVCTACFGRIMAFPGSADELTTQLVKLEEIMHNLRDLTGPRCVPCVRDSARIEELERQVDALKAAHAAQQRLLDPRVSWTEACAKWVSEHGKWVLDDLADARDCNCKPESGCVRAVGAATLRALLEEKP